jgi:arginine decarboxylase
VLGVTSYGDLSQFAQQQSRASAFILSIDDEEFTRTARAGPGGAEPAPFHWRSAAQEPDVPIYVYGETKTSRHLPNDILRELHGFIHMFEDTPEFVARHIIREAKSYLEGCSRRSSRRCSTTPKTAPIRWHCPGHSGGVAFLKSPVGQMFHQFYGENMLRADVCNAVEELGQLLDHNGAIGESERNAARIFNADHCFFVTNGTSTSNKMVWHHTVAPGDVVVVDRNCHKSILHAIIMTGAIPVFLKPTRNHFGIIGPIPQSEFEPAAIKAKIRANPLLKGVDAEVRQAAHPDAHAVHLRRRALQHRNHQRHAGRLRGQPALRRGLAAARGLPPVLWPYHAMGKKRARPKTPWCIPPSPFTSCWRASARPAMCWCRIRRTTKLDRHLFNEAYLMHTSTSPQYSIIASCDVAAAMMEPPGGTALVEESILEALDFRRAMRKVDDEYGSDWWFKVWGPDKLVDEGIGRADDWIIRGDRRGRKPAASGTASASWPTASTCWTRSRPPSSRRA